MTSRRHYCFSTLLFILLLAHPHSSVHAADFCVADLTSQTTSGYTCKNPTNVTVDDFVFTALIRGSNTTNMNKAAAGPGFVQLFPDLNELGLAIARGDFKLGGAIPLHSHLAASEMIYMVEGSITAGFISRMSNVVYVKKVNKGEVYWNM